MVVLLHGIIEMGAQVMSNLCYLMCLRHLSRANRIFLRKDPFFFMRAQNVLSYHQVPQRLVSTVLAGLSSIIVVIIVIELLNFRTKRD